ncbi:MAG TPA: AAC(3) family N-acetyltransferase, partial [Acidimicrobiaceae bacterium]|nr:AAC(3) family N-acetyltransferase [Acidimicrobiaceae bacterium]
MSEADAVALVDRPAAVDDLFADLRSLGVAEGATVLVHSSLSRLGYICGGAQAVVAALLQAVGPDGTVAMPTHSSNLSDPAAWVNPPVP